MLTDLQKKTAQAIVNVFETGTVLGRYDSVTLIPGDSGHLTYGRSQTTLASGNLALLIRRYCEAEGAAFDEPLRPFLARLANRDLSLDHDRAFKNLLRLAGDDPVMRATQDDFFDQVYWSPALATARQDGIQTALGTAVVYDSRVHGSWIRIRAMTGGTALSSGETTWIARYVATRRHWLATHSNAVLHKTVYRMDAFKKLIEGDRWDLSLPLTLLGVTITEHQLLGGSASAEDPEDDVVLHWTDPPTSGPQVAKLQQALKAAGIPIEVDGLFARATDEAVRRFQANNQLKVDGIVGPATRAALGI